jgi:hypothetical protein
MLPKPELNQVSHFVVQNFRRQIHSHNLVRHPMVNIVAQVFHAT